MTTAPSTAPDPHSLPDVTGITIGGLGGECGDFLGVHGNSLQI